MSAFLKYFLFVLFTISNCLEENIDKNGFCTRDDVACSGKNIQSDGIKEQIDKAHPYHNLILSQISTSLSNYKECKSNNCSCYFQTLTEDFKPFKNGITKNMVDSIRSKGVTYLIYNHKLYRDKDCLFPARCSGNEHFLLQLIKKLDNMELIINVRDWPQTSRDFNIFGPVLSFSKTPDNYDIMYPAWSFWEGGPAIRLYPTGLGRWDLHRKSLKEESGKYSWEKKKPTGFFRGSRTSEKRDPLILLARKRPDLVDAQYTKNQAWKSSADTLGAEPAKEVSLEHHCQYKYLFNFRGVAASFRLKHLFLCGSLVIHVGSEWEEFFYSALKPWIHYIPLKDNASEDEIAKLIMFLQNHDDIVKDIAIRGQKFITDHLSLKEVKCYWRSLLKRYQKLMRYAVEFNDNLIEIK